MAWNHGLIWTFACLLSVKLFALPPRDHGEMYVPMLDWGVASGPGRLVLVLSPSFFAYKFGLVFCASQGVLLIY